MSPDGLVTLRDVRDKLLLILNHLDHLYGDIAINEPVGECIVMVASLRQEVTDAINVSQVQSLDDRDLASLRG